MKKLKKLVLTILMIVILLNGPIGGAVLQTTVSCVSYLGSCVVSIFNKDVREDMKSIKYNPFNTSEEKVLDSGKVCFYKGVAFYRTDIDRSGSFCAVLLGYWNDTDAVKHEWGHTIQQLILGPVTYFLMIGAPSFLEWSERDYYDRPWEITADMFGGVERTYYSADKARGGAYLATSLFTGPFGYLFLIAEY